MKSLISFGVLPSRAAALMPMVGWTGLLKVNALLPLFIEPRAACSFCAYFVHPFV